MFILCIMEDDSKKISIKGTHNKYAFKKFINKEEKKIKKREITKDWNFSDKYYDYEMQIKILEQIKEQQEQQEEEQEVSKIIIQEIRKKISGYKQQDIIKKKWNVSNFITFENIIEKMIHCNLSCYYCREKMNVLYDISRESKQWSVDRIDNNVGHNTDNFYLACLQCNLQRRRKNDEKFLFTKQLFIVKQE